MIIIQTKRVYDPPEEKDGSRILVDLESLPGKAAPNQGLRELLQTGGGLSARRHPAPRRPWGGTLCQRLSLEIACARITMRLWDFKQLRRRWRKPSKP